MGFRKRSNQSSAFHDFLSAGIDEAINDYWGGDVAKESYGMGRLFAYTERCGTEERRNMYQSFVNSGGGGDTECWLRGYRDAIAEITAKEITIWGHAVS